LDQTPSTVTRAPFGQAKLDNVRCVVFFPDACIEEDRDDVFEPVAGTLTEVVGEAKLVTSLPVCVLQTALTLGVK
jgi:hypothetical protein